MTVPGSFLWRGDIRFARRGADQGQAGLKDDAHGQLPAPRRPRWTNAGQGTLPAAAGAGRSCQLVDAAGGSQVPILLFDPTFG